MASISPSERSKYSNRDTIKMKTLQKRPVIGHSTAALLAAAVAVTGTSSTAIAQDNAFAEIAVAQAQLNATEGGRQVPGRMIPVPGETSTAAQALIASPYSPFWNVAPANDAEWSAMVSFGAEATLPSLVDLRSTLGISIESAEMGGVPIHILRPEIVPAHHETQLLINFHGGGYVFGPGASGTGEATAMAAYGGYEVIAVDYRMPPHDPFPAAVNDALAVYRAALETHDPSRIAVFGTSAGGGLVLALMHRIRMESLPMPGAIAPNTPWSDLTKTGDSYETNEWMDNVLVSYDGYLGRAAVLYAGGHDMSDPLLSPVNGKFADFPPTILASGTRDLFLSNTVRVHRALRRANIEADLHIYEGFSHAQYIFDWTMPETREIYKEIERFFDLHLAQ